MIGAADTWETIMYALAPSESKDQFYERTAKRWREIQLSMVLDAIREM